VPVGAAAEVAGAVLGSAAGGAAAPDAGALVAAELAAAEAAEPALLEVVAAAEELLAGAADSAEQAAAAASTAVPETARTVRRGRTRGAGVTGDPPTSGYESARQPIGQDHYKVLFAVIPRMVRPDRDLVGPIFTAIKPEPSSSDAMNTV
jgi:hypothetical protein